MERKVRQINRKDKYIRKKEMEAKGLNRDSNPGPLAPKARIIPLDH